MAELNSIPGLFPVKTPTPTPPVSLRYQLEVTDVFASVMTNVFPDETLSPSLFWFSLGLVALFEWIWSVVKHGGLCKEMEFSKIIYEEIGRPR